MKLPLLALLANPSIAFLSLHRIHVIHREVPLRSSSDDRTDSGGADMAAEFFNVLRLRNLPVEGEEIDDVEDEDIPIEIEGEEAGEEDDDDAILMEYDVPTEASFTNQEMYSDLKDRMFDNAGTFLQLNRDDDGDDFDTGGEAEVAYKPPVVVPDSGLSAVEVVKLVISAIRNNDVPSPDYGIGVFFGYSGQGSQVREQIEKGMTADQYKKFLLSSKDYTALFQHDEIVIDKSEVVSSTRRAYFTARLIHNDPSLEDVSVNFVLSTTGDNDDDCWYIDSMLIRPSFMRRKRRR